MAKPRHDQTPTSNKTTLIIMAIGGVLVAGLIVWALTRTVEPASVMTTTDAAPVASATAPAPVPPTFDTGFPALSTATAANPQVTAQPSPGEQPPPQVEGDRAEVRRIAVEDLKAQVDRGAVTVVDVRDAASYARGHIPGAINIPFASVESQMDEIPKGKPIVTYCT